jgi:uncharacterized protein YndB with AHSA1/START domain
MNTTSQPPDEKLTLTQELPAPAKKVFQAWTTPNALHRWFAPSDQFQTPIAEVDLHVGGHYRIGMIAPDGSPHTVAGRYIQIVPNQKLAFTWQWQVGGSTPNETTVTLDFTESNNVTTLTLTHTHFPTTESKDHHQQGWTGVLDRLKRNL